MDGLSRDKIEAQRMEMKQFKHCREEIVRTKIQVVCGPVVKGQI